MTMDPAHAGMILFPAHEEGSRGNGPRACGDDPILAPALFRITIWTPRMRG